MRLLFYLVDLLFAALAWRALARLFQSFLRPPGASPSSSRTWNSSRNAGSPRTVQGQTARDPVCGMFVSTELSHRLERNGKILHFCSPECLEHYRKQVAGAKG